MMASAGMTLSFLRLHKNDNALLCMPMEYIAGKMMTVRALVGGLNLICIPPSGHPLGSIGTDLKFAAMIPLQIFNSLNDAEERYALMRIKNIIIGGGAIDRKMEDELSSFTNNIWSTYGMTETLSHVAMRKITGDGKSSWYTPLNGVKISVTTENALIISAPHICTNKIITNDIAQIGKNGLFKILGRKDNIINSGGIKIQIEDIEEMLTGKISFPFLITSRKDNKFGEKIVLIVQADKKYLTKIEEICQNILPHYWIPKKILFIDSLPMTGNGKPDRAKAKEIANR
jgi:Acyl-CoA synthetases (AMP-forming)/AMP-acid ligases II